MGIRLKLLLPAVGSVAAIILFFHGYWLPDYKESETKRHNQFHQASIQTLRAALAKPVMQQDFQSIERVVSAFREQSQIVTGITLYGVNEQVVYELKPENPYAAVSRSSHLLYSTADELVGELVVRTNGSGHDLPAMKQLVQLEYVAGIVFLLSILLGTFFQDLMLRRPIKSLASVVNRLARNDHSHQLPPASNDEVGDLVRAIETLDEHISIARERLTDQVVNATEMAHELSSVNTKLDTILSSLSYGLIIANSKGMIDSINPALCQITGYTEEELIGQNVKMLMEADLRGRHDSVLKEYRGRETSEVVGRGPIEVSLLSKTGEIIPVEIALESMAMDDELCFVAVIQDIRERKQAAKALQEERDKAASYLDTVEVMMLAIDKQGTINLINRKGCQILGYEEKELLGKNWFETCIPEELREKCYKNYLALESEEGRDYRELPVLTASGVQKIIAWHYSVLRDEAGRMRGLLSSGSDISDFKLKEKERQQIQSQLQQAQKMEAVGQLTGGIAHDFNNIIASIMGHTELVITRLKYLEDDKVHTYLDHVYKSSERARDLVEKMLAFSRGQGGGAPSDIELDTAIDDVIKMLRSIIPATIEINAHYEHEAMSAMTTTIDLQQVVMNLCINARDAMTGTGKIDISVYRANNAKAVCASCHGNLDGNYVVVSVKDTGPGISAKDQKKIFEPFFSTKGVGEGSGMGLSVVHGVIHEHGGHIEVKSEKGVGTEFLIYLRAAGEQTEESNEKLVALEKNIERTGVILVVDDEPLVGNFVSEVLEADGHTVVAIDDPLKALNVVEKNPHMIAMVLTDFNMPEMDGVTLAEKIRALECGVPIVICTGYSDAVDEKRSEAAGVSAIIKKPMKAGELSELVENVLAANNIIRFPQSKQH